jgi:tetraacyldisaccharide 4'-kinase
MATGMIERIFRRIWYNGSKGPALTIPTLLMAPFSLLYGRIVAARNRRFDLGVVKPARLPCRVVSVGNLTVGGTGKTPMVIRLAGMLRDRGYRPVVLSRGYGGTSKSPVNVVSRGSGPLMKEREAGDEPVLIAKSAVGIPVVTGPRRTLTGDWAIKNLNADVLILDDGFQHRHLFRDIDIVLLNAANPFGNGRLLPGGPLREPPSALKRADIIIATGTYDDVTTSRTLMLPDGFHAPVFKCYYQPRKLLHGNPETAFPTELLHGKKICAFAGIGNPLAFEKTLAALGADVAVFIPFPDHHRYTQQDIGLIDEKARQCGAQMIVTTEKDMIKIEAFDVFPGDIYALRIEMEFLSGREDFERLLLDKLRAL